MVVNAIVLVSSFVPAINEWVSSHPTETMAILGAVNIVLRLVTKEKVQLFEV